MSCFYTYKGYKLDEALLREVLMREITTNPSLYTLRSMMLSVQSDLNDKLDALSRASEPLIKGKSGENYIGVSRLLEQNVNVGEVDIDGLPISRPLCPIYNEDYRIENSISKMKEQAKYSSYNRTQLIAEIKAKIKEEKAVSEFGTLFHDLVSFAIKNHTTLNGIHQWGYESSTFIDELDTQVDKIMENKPGTDENGYPINSMLHFLTHKVNGTVTRDQIRKKLLDQVTKIEETLFKNPQYKNAIIKSEVPISSTDVNLAQFIDANGATRVCEGVKGIADIIVIKSEEFGGGIDVIDLKVATREYSDWYAAKLYHTEYQLGMYRSILGANGYDISNMNLKVFPISVADGDFNTLSINNRTPMVELTATSGHHVAHLDPNIGEFTKLINKLINISIPDIVQSESDLEERIDKSVEALIDMFEDDKSEKEYTKQELIDKIKEYTNTSGKTFYILRDINTGESIIRTKKEDFSKDGGIIDKMLNDKKNILARQIESIVTTIEQAQLNTDVPDHYAFLDVEENKNQTLFRIMQTTFGQYASSPNYRIIANMPELRSRGIILIQHVKTNIIDAIMLTHDDLRLLRQTSLGDKLLSKFYSTELLQLMNLYAQTADGLLKPKKPMLATKANMKIMEIMCALNECSDRLKNFQIGKIKVINPADGLMECANDIDEVKANFSALIKAGNSSETPLVDHFKDRSIRTSSMADIVVSELENIMYRTLFNTDIKQIVHKLQTDQFEIDQTVDQLLKLKVALEKAYRFSPNKLDFSTPELKAYFLVCETITYYKDIFVHGTGTVSKHGLQGGNLRSLFGALAGRTSPKVGKSGYTNDGVLQGSYESSPGLSPSDPMFELQKWIDSGMLNLREEFFDLAYRVNKLCANYEKRHKSIMTSAMLNDRTNLYERLLLKGLPGSDILLQNPYSSQCDLDSEDKQFLEEILWEINKWKLFKFDLDKLKWNYSEHKNEILQNDEVKKAMNSGRYFQLPLRRASHFARLKSIGETGIIQYFQDKWNHLDDEINPFKEHSVLTVNLDKLTKETTTEVYNRYDISDQTRLYVLDNVTSPFETDLNLLVLDMAYQFTRKRCYDEVLAVGDALYTVLSFYNINSDKDLENEIQTVKDQMSISILNKSILEDEYKDATKAIAAAKKLNSVIVLGARPLLLIKEGAFGWFSNLSRAFALKGTSNEVSYSNIFKARCLVFGQLLGKYGKNLTASEEQDFTMMQQINQMYGIANQDSNQLVDKAAKSRKGIMPGLSRWMFVFSTAQDFTNRMTLFCGKMMEDGCFEAHELDENGILHYDFTKDKRFSKLNKIGFFDSEGNEIKSNDKEYLQLKALYRAMWEQFQLEKVKFKFGEALPKAYTLNQKASMKEISDLAYGFYDHETKSLEDYKLFGLIFKQFMTFWTAKTTLWLRAPGSNTSTGKYVNMVDENGKTLYRRITQTPSGPQLDLITEDEMTDEERGYLEPQQVWQGDYVEGLLYSVLYTINDICTLHWKDIVNNPYRVANLKLAMHDLLIGYILFYLMKLIFGGEDKSLQAMNPVIRLIARGAQDVGPQGIFSLNWEPSFWTQVVNMKKDFTKLLAGNKTVGDLLISRVGFARDWNVDDM